MFVQDACDCVGVCQYIGGILWEVGEAVVFLRVDVGVVRESLGHRRKETLVETAVRIARITDQLGRYSMQDTQPSTSVPSSAICRSRM
jgi:hypothetical protein